MIFLGGGESACVPKPPSLENGSPSILVDKFTIKTIQKRGGAKVDTPIYRERGLSYNRERVRDTDGRAVP